MKTIPAGKSLIVLVGPSGSGKSHLASQNFPDREIVSTDAIRLEFTGDVRRQDKNEFIKDEFLSRIEAKLRVGQRVVADATHIRNKDRRETAEIGELMNVPVIYMVVDRPMKTKVSHGGWRLEEYINGRPLLESHQETFNANEQTILLGDHVKGRVVIDTRVDEWEVTQPLRRDPYWFLPSLLERGFEYVRVIADIHGNMNGFKQALDGVDDRGVTFFLSLGDVVDYGSRTLDAAMLMEGLVQNGEAVMVRGNHDRKIARWIEHNRAGKWQGSLTHGNEVTTNQLLAMSPAKRALWEDRFLGLVDMSPDWIQVRTDFMFTHAAVHERMWNNTIHRAKPDSSLEAMAMYGETTGKKDKFGRPERIYNWVDDLEPGCTAVVGHAVRSLKEPFVHRGSKGGRAVFLDTGCSKEIDEFDGKTGFLSWMDFDILQPRRSEPKLVTRGFGREV